MIFGGNNSFAQLKDMLASDHPVIATVSNVHTDGTVTVQHRGGASQRVRTPTAYSVGADVLVHESKVVGEAPALSSSSISLG